MLLVSLKKILKNMITFFNKRSLLKKQNVNIESNVSINRTEFSKYNRICKNSSVNDSSFGLCSYIGWNCVLNNVEVGSFTSIGPYTEVIYGRHPVNFISTHPIFYSTRKQCGISFTQKQLFDDFQYVKNTTKSVLIGNDVWIGYGVKIVEGVKIGDGSIVLAGAVVTKDVEPYSIVGGIPAKHVKYRFDEDMRNKLINFKWWQKDFQWIQENSKYFSDPESFKNLIGIQ